MKKISAVVITYNEERKIERALISLKAVSDEIVVVDSYSTDDTVMLCQRHTERVIQRSWHGYRDQKQFAAELAQYDWVLSLDADEMLSPRLEEEIGHWKRRESSSCNGYYIPRKTFFMGRWIEHTSWYPDRQLRLFRKSCGRWEGGRVHESVQVTGPTGRLKEEMYHHTYATVSEYLVQLERFSTLAAQDSFESGRRAHWIQLAFYPATAFVKNYLLKRGFLDGIPGLIVSLLAGVSTLFKYLKLRELQSAWPDQLSVAARDD